MIAVMALGWAINVRDGLFQPWALVGLTICILLVGGEIFTRSVRIFDSFRIRLHDRLEKTVMLTGILFCFLSMYLYLPGSWHGPRATHGYHLMLYSAMASCIAAVWMDRYRWIFFGIAICFFTAMGTWIIYKVPQPYMDVWMLQTEGLKAMSNDNNPFASTFVDSYNRPELYAPGALQNGIVHQGFPYPPMVLWMDYPGFALGGDYRWSNLFSMIVSAVLIALMRPKSRYGMYAALLLLFTPRALFVLESGWTEPTTLLLFTATIFCAVRFPKLMPIFLGMFLCSKQYLLFAIPPIILLERKEIRWAMLVKMLMVAFFVGCAVSLPLILLDIKAFKAANFDIASKAAFRVDALSYLALLSNVTNFIPSNSLASICGFGTAIIATIFTLRRRMHSPFGYAIAVAFIHLIFFAFYKFAFCNYYYFLIGTICAAIGAMECSEEKIAV